MSHKELYPDQYAHKLCGELVHFTNKPEGRRFRVARVVSSKFGLLAVPATEGEETTAYDIRHLTVVNQEDE